MVSQSQGMSLLSIFAYYTGYSGERGAVVGWMLKWLFWGAGGNSYV